MENKNIENKNKIIYEEKMSLENKFVELGIKKMLVVDDKKENLDAAKKYLDQFVDVHVDYVNSGSEAIAKIKDFYISDRYNLVLTDLEMETPDAGREVVFNAWNYQSLAQLVTGRQGSRGHGPSISIHPLKKTISGYKNDTKVWENIVETIVSDIYEEPQFLHSMNHYYEFVKKPFDNTPIAGVFESLLKDKYV